MMRTMSIDGIELINGSPAVVAAAFQCSYPTEVGVSSSAYSVSTNANLMTPTNALSDSTIGTGDLSETFTLDVAGSEIIAAGSTIEILATTKLNLEQISYYFEECVIK